MLARLTSNTFTTQACVWICNTTDEPKCVLVWVASKSDIMLRTRCCARTWDWGVWERIWWKHKHTGLWRNHRHKHKHKETQTQTLSRTQIWSESHIYCRKDASSFKLHNYKWTYLLDPIWGMTKDLSTRAKTNHHRMGDLFWKWINADHILHIVFEIDQYDKYDKWMVSERRAFHLSELTPLDPYCVKFLKRNWPIYGLLWQMNGHL